MEILRECYQWDKRKPFHVLTFADQALEYWEVYADDEALGYLATAHHWLSDESQRYPWNRHLRRLLPKVARKLGR